MKPCVFTIYKTRQKNNTVLPANLHKNNFSNRHIPHFTSVPSVLDSGQYVFHIEIYGFLPRIQPLTVEHVDCVSVIESLSEPYYLVCAKYVVQTDNPSGILPPTSLANPDLI